MKKLSIFVDESGDFGTYQKHSPYYVITLVLHDQDIDISPNLKRLDEAMKNMGYGDNQAIHTEPLIRREAPYKYFTPSERRAIFSRLFYFALGCDVKYKTFIYEKMKFENKFKFEAQIAKDLSQFIQENFTYFQLFEIVFLYYDNGQHELNRILNTVFATQFTHYEVRRVLPNEYRLFQVADLICTLELLRIKTQHQDLTKSEKRIFYSKRDLNKDFLKGIKKKEFR